MKTFNFDHVFWTATGQAEIYRTMAQPLVDSLLGGYNVCLFGYGQTGSGKTYTMMGGDSTVESGIIPRFYNDLLNRIQQMTDNGLIEATNCEISYFEVYNERIYDLLTPPPKVEKPKRPLFSTSPYQPPPKPKPSLQIRESSERGVFIPGLTTRTVSHQADADQCLRAGNEQRATASTGMNEKSSRSHSIFQISLKLKGLNGQKSINCRANLIDLAGSERSDRAGTSGMRLKEGAAINKSLLTLGKVISTLAENKSGSTEWVPYRDSILTHLLRDSLGGNSQTAMIATVSCAASCKDETLSTLHYAQKAKAIVNNAKVNEEEEAATIRELQKEIELLKKSNLFCFTFSEVICN